jgi:hypothetical protein
VTINRHARRALAAALFVTFASRTPEADAATVGVVAPPDSPRWFEEAWVRLRGELDSVGHVTRRLNGAPGSPTGGDVDAVVAFEGQPLPSAVVVSVPDRPGHSGFSRRVALDADEASLPRTLAIRSLELVRACLVEADLETPSAEVAPAPSAPEPPSSARFPFRLGAEAGALVGVAPASGLGPWVAPLVRVRLSLARGPLLELELAGEGSSPVVATNAGSASIAQDAVLLGVGWKFDLGWPVEPLVILAAGLLRTAVEATPSPTYEGHAARQWSALGVLWTGVEFPLGVHAYVRGGAGLEAARPYPVVRFANDEVATVARPALLFSLSLGARL